MRKALHDYGFMTVMLLAAAAFVTFLVVFPTKVIQTGSMAPTLPVGSFVFEQPVSSLHPGDVITFQQKEMPTEVTHRFIGYGPNGAIMTQGDHNKHADVRLTPLTMKDVKSVAWGWITPIQYLIVLAMLLVLITCIIVYRKLGKVVPTTQETPATTPV